jgi:hypothetical protein
MPLEDHVLSRFSPRVHPACLQADPVDWVVFREKYRSGAKQFLRVEQPAYDSCDRNQQKGQPDCHTTAQEKDLAQEVRFHQVFRMH